ncbi:ATP-binding protein [Falsiroseomonas sp. CW058]|uniref:ATP-binding protein n=1 Tax=Falsiroseomonas sp. CW058 TaxID=3388664 RepID=UPI003D31256A
MPDPTRLLEPVSSMLDSLGIAFAAFDAHDCTLLWNGTFLRLFPEHDGHVHVGEHYSRNLRRFYACRLDPAEMEHIDRHVADGVARHQRQAWPFEFQHRGQWMRVASLPVEGVGRLRIWTPTAAPRDPGAVARRLADGGRDALVTSIDHIVDGLMMRDAAGRITMVNRRFAALYRLSGEAEAIGRTFAEVLRDAWAGLPQGHAALPALADSLHFAGAPFELSLPGDARVRVSEHRGADGGTVSIHVDISDLHRLQRATSEAQERAEALAASLREQIEERERAEAALRQAQRIEVVGQLTAGVAHDFNNLFSVMLTNLELLERMGEGPARRGRLSSLRHAVERGAALTDRLLAFARRQPLLPRAVALGEVARGMLPLIDAACPDGIEPRLDIPPDLPAALVDPTQLELAILNLAINARDAMPDGGELRVTARVETLDESADPEAPAAGTYVSLGVADTGTGMSEEVRARAIEPFFTTKPPGRGSGLGLSQVYGLARQSGGTLRIDTAPGRGSTVRILLPLAEAAPAAPAPSAPPRAAAAQVRVLLVDDDPDVLDGMADALRMMEFQVTAVPGGAEAVRALEAGLDIDVLVTDVRMPRMTGPDLARWAWQRLPGLPVLFVSGYAAPEALAGLRQRFRLLRKPCASAEVEAAIHQLLCREIA